VLHAKGYGGTCDDDCTALLALPATTLTRPPPNWPGSKFGVIQNRGWIAKIGTGRFADEWSHDAVVAAQEGCRDTLAGLMEIDPASLTRDHERASVKPPGAPAMYAHLDQNRLDDLQCVIVPTSAVQSISGRIGGRVGCAWVRSMRFGRCGRCARAQQLQTDTRQQQQTDAQRRIQMCNTMSNHSQRPPDPEMHRSDPQMLRPDPNMHRPDPEMPRPDPETARADPEKARPDPSNTRADSELSAPIRTRARRILK
jgi:hypothetical protein